MKTTINKLLILTIALVGNIQLQAQDTPQQYQQQTNKPATRTDIWKMKTEGKFTSPAGQESSQAPVERRSLWERFKDWWYTSQEKPVRTQTAPYGQTGQTNGGSMFSPTKTMGTTGTNPYEQSRALQYKSPTGAGAQTNAPYGQPAYNPND